MRAALLALSLALLSAIQAAAAAVPLGTAGDSLPRPVDTWLETQVELHRRGFSCGQIDGIVGPMTRAALTAWQESQGLAQSGVLDAGTREHLRLTAPATAIHFITEDDLTGLRPVPDTWLGKSEQDSLPYATVLERIAEQYRASPGILKRLNPLVNWGAVKSGEAIEVPNVESVELQATATRLEIRLGAHVLRAFDTDGNLIAQFPVTIGRTFAMRPVGELKVTTVIANPDFTFDPAVFPESAEGKALGRRLIIPPGPNNPVGLAWIGLDRPGYGIHGTPSPERIGATESHGCFRLANWDALTLLHAAWVGMPVTVVE